MLRFSVLVLISAFVVGTLFISSDGTTAYHRGGVPLGFGTYTSEALSVNDEGSAVGYRVRAAPPANSGRSYEAVLDVDGRITVIQTPAFDESQYVSFHNTSRAVDVNDLLEVVGYYWAPRAGGQAGSRNQSFVWDANNGLRTLDDLFAGNGDSRVSAINNAGQLVGTSLLLGAGNNSPRAVMWDRAGNIVELGTLGGFESEAR